MHARARPSPLFRLITLDTKRPTFPGLSGVQQSSRTAAWSWRKANAFGGAPLAKNVSPSWERTPARQCIQKRLMDEIFVSVVPVLVGDGVLLFDVKGGAAGGPLCPPSLQLR